jgi:creatinine amidohydrolase
MRGDEVSATGTDSGRRVRAWAELTTVELAAAVADDPVAVLPLAAIEQHGPHLPLSTDMEIARGLLEEACRRLPEGVPVLTLPMQAMGASAEHLDFTGTLSLPGRTLERSIRAVGASLAASGVRRLVLFNSHGGNRSVLDDAALKLRRDHSMLVVKATYTRFPRPDRVVLPEDEWRHGLHGGALETAMMLHLRPDLVKADKVDTFPSLGEELDRDLRHLGPEGAAAFAWTAADLNASGVTGDARLATPSTGKHLVAHYGEILAQVLADAYAFPVERLVRGSGGG